MLPCSLRYIDGNAYLYYDITSRQNIAQLFDKKVINRQWLTDFLWSMRRVRQEMSRFLLEESNIVWFPKAYEQYETAGEVYLQQKIYEDAECLRISGIDPTEHTKEEMIQQKTEDILPAEEKIENKREENRTTGEKKSLFALWENRKKKEKQERENYSRNLQLTMNGYAVAEETAYEEEDMGRTVYMGEQSAMREIKHRLLTEEGSLIATLDQEAYTIGKKRGEADLVLEDLSISRLHARIVKEEDGYYLEDMNSTNGTFKNGLRMQPYEKRKLEEGDEITFGKRTLIYR